MPFMLFALPCSLLELVSRVPPAAEPPVPSADEPPLVAPRPTVEADVPPAAALPPVPPEAAPGVLLPAPTVEADCAIAREPAPTISALARNIDLNVVIVCLTCVCL